MEFFKGIVFVAILYLLAFLTYRLGYIMGAESEQFNRALANLKIKQCAEAIMGKK